MTKYTALRDVAGVLTIHVMAGPRAKSSVYVYHASDDTTPIVTADINLNDETEQSGVLARLPEALQSEASGALKRLAAGVAAQRLSHESKPVSKGDTSFPEIDPWDGEVDGRALMQTLCAVLARYMVLPQFADVAIALWIVHTYLAGVSDFTPYILISSPVRECGKSTLLEILFNLAHRAQLSGGYTAASLYRRIDRTHPTMLLDELDTRLRGDSGELLRGVLNTGFHRSGKITICVGDAHEDKDFSTYCPKVLAGIGRAWDTVTSRSIPIRLQRASKLELKGRARIRGDRIGSDLLPYRRMLLTLAANLEDEVRIADPATPEELGARQADVWRPLLAIADAVGGEWPERARAAAVALHGVAEEEGDYGLLMLDDVRVLFETRAEDGKLPSQIILEELLKREERPWPEYRNGQPITKRGIAQLLGRFEVHPKNIRTSVGVSKGYELEEMQPAFTRYLTPLEVTATGATPTVALVAERTVGVAPKARIPGTCMQCGRTGLPNGAAICVGGLHMAA